jgi:hypothetical protein
VQLDKLWELVVKSLWAPETYVKLLFVAVTTPFWLPLVKVLYREIKPALTGPADPSAEVRRPPSEDPFLNIPLASHRARLGAARSPRSAAPSTQRSARPGFGARG